MRAGLSTGHVHLFLRSDRLCEGTTPTWIPLDPPTSGGSTAPDTDVLGTAPLFGRVQGEPVRAPVRGNRLALFRRSSCWRRRIRTTYPAGRAGFRVGYTLMRLDYGKLEPLAATLPGGGGGNAAEGSAFE